jgi:hypothetical protein
MQRHMAKSVIFFEKRQDLCHSLRRKAKYDIELQSELNQTCLVKHNKKAPKTSATSGGKPPHQRPQITPNCKTIRPTKAQYTWHAKHTGHDQPPGRNSTKMKRQTQHTTYTEHPKASWKRTQPATPC